MSRRLKRKEDLREGRELETLTLEKRQSSASANEPGIESWAHSTEGFRIEAQAQTPNAAESIQEVLSPVRTESIPAAKKDRAIAPLDPPDLRALAAQSVHQPLFDPRWQREIAVAATAQLLPLGLIDVRALVARVARGLPVVHLPRRRRWSVSRGAQLLIDGSRGMEPYRNDQAAFASVVKSVVGPERVEVVEFENAPLRGVYWSDDTVRRPYRSAGPEVPVLVLTDCGLAGPVDDTARARADEWQDFATVARTSPRILALVPYPPELVPVRVPQEHPGPLLEPADCTSAYSGSPEERRGAHCGEKRSHPDGGTQSSRVGVIVFFHQQDGHSESRRRGVAPRVVGIVFCLTLIARKPAPEGRADSVALQDGFRVCAVDLNPYS